MSRDNNEMRRVAVSFAVIVLFTALFQQPLSASPDPRISAIVNRVKAADPSPAVDSFAEFLEGLPVDQDDARGYYEDGTAQEDLVYTRSLIYVSLVRALGQGHVTRQKFNADGYQGVNIIGVIPGSGPNRARQYLITAHYDSVQNPGADDNGTGLAALLLAAQVLGKYHFNATLVFAALDQEEEEGRNNDWARGSQFLAETAKANRTRIAAVIAIDMIGFNYDDNDRATISRVDTQSGSASQALQDQVIQAFNDYTDLHIKAMTGEDESDPYRFFNAGFPAVLVSEQFDAENWPLNPYYHEDEDFYRAGLHELQQCAGSPYIDVDYATRIVRGVVGWAAAAAGLLDFPPNPQ